MRKHDDVTRRLLGLCEIEIRVVFRDAVVHAARGLIPLVLKQLVGHAYLDVVGFGRKNHQRLVLRFPTNPCYGPVVSVSVLVPRDAERLFGSQI